MSDSATPWTVAHRAPLSMESLQAGILEWVAILFSSGTSLAGLLSDPPHNRTETDKEIENLNMPKTVKELKSVVQNLPSDR